MTTTPRTTTAIRFGPDLHERLKDEAARLDRSMNWLVCNLVRRGLEQLEPPAAEPTMDEVRVMREAIEEVVRVDAELDSEEVASPFFGGIALLMPDALADNQLRFLESYEVDGIDVMRRNDFAGASNVEVLEWAGVEGRFVSSVPSEILDRIDAGS